MLNSILLVKKKIKPNYYLFKQLQFFSDKYEKNIKIGNLRSRFKIAKKKNDLNEKLIDEIKVLKDVICFRCGKPGHSYTQCSHPDSRRCLNCGEVGHTFKDCKQTKCIKPCFNCGEPGHTKSNCPHKLSQKNMMPSKKNESNSMNEMQQMISKNIDVHKILNNNNSLSDHDNKQITTNSKHDQNLISSKTERINKSISDSSFNLNVSEAKQSVIRLNNEETVNNEKTIDSNLIYDDLLSKNTKINKNNEIYDDLLNRVRPLKDRKNEKTKNLMQDKNLNDEKAVESNKNGLFSGNNFKKKTNSKIKNNMKTSNVICQLCFKVGHIAIDCENYLKYKCTRCNEFGHSAFFCKSVPKKKKKSMISSFKNLIFPI